MKKAILLLIFAGAFFSCQKQKFCWTCLIQVTAYSSPNATSSSEKVEMCDKSQSDIDAYVKSASKTQTVAGVRMVTNVTCVKKQ